MMSHEKITGLAIPNVTPFREDDIRQIDVEKLDRLVDYLIEVQKADMLIPVGTTGESTSLSHEEKELVIERVIKRANKRVKVFAGTGGANTDEVIGLTRFAEKAGAQGVLVVAPYYIRPDQEGLYQHFKKVAESTNLPIILYNIPLRSAVNISVDTVLRLARIPNIVAIKDCYGDIGQTTELLRRCRTELDKPFSVMTGEDSNLFVLLALGGDGIIGATGHIVGAQMKKLMQLFSSGRIEEARDLQFALLPIKKLLFASPNPTAIKAALTLMETGLGSDVRLPLVKSSEDVIAKLRVELPKCLNL